MLNINTFIFKQNRWFVTLCYFILACHVKPTANIPIGSKQLSFANYPKQIPPIA